MKRALIPDTLSRLALLADPVRSRLYAYVAGRREVSRDEAAEAVGVTRALAAFHLDKLAAAGILDTSFRRVSGRTGPGAGRPSKLYRRSERTFEVTLPPRRHELLAALLAAAANEEPPDADGRQAAAFQLGTALGSEAGPLHGTGRSGAAVLSRVEQLLTEIGYEPHRGSGGELRLRNCPFDPVSRAHRDVVCPMNQALIHGLVTGLKARGVDAFLEPADGECCVVLRPGTRAASRLRRTL